MKKIKVGLSIVLILLLSSLNVMAAVQPSVSTNNNDVKVEGKLNSNTNVSLVILDNNNERQYLDQIKTDGSGNFKFELRLKEGVYTGKVSTELNQYDINFEVKNGTSTEPDAPGNGGGSGVGGGSDIQSPVETPVIQEVIRKSFRDIENHWAKNEIELLAGKGIISGMSEDIFKPDDNITRAQFATLIVNLLNFDTETYSGKFSDVKENDWFTLYIEAAAKEGIVLGSQGLFNPNKEITREEMAVIILRVMEYKGILVESNSLEFTDKNNISLWALDSVGKAFEKGIIKGMTETTFEPKLNATRAQAAVMINRLMELF